MYTTNAENSPVLRPIVTPRPLNASPIGPLRDDLLPDLEELRRPRRRVCFPTRRRHARQHDVALDDAADLE